jgi:hypothetical protein
MTDYKNETNANGNNMTRAKPTFWDVKAILDWLTNHRTTAQLQSRHGPQFKWAKRDDLVNAVVQLDPSQCTLDVDCFKLIDPSLVGVGRGGEANLVKALRDSDGVAGNGRMPFGGNGDGQFATPLQIETIIAWIDLGCPA